MRRNHHYKLHIEGALSFGQASFAEALEAAATNNVWISISDEVNEVEDTDYILTVEKTFVVLDESFTENGGSYTLNYTIKGKNDKAITEADAATVSDRDISRYTCFVWKITRNWKVRCLSRRDGCNAKSRSSRSGSSLSCLHGSGRKYTVI